MGFGWVLGVVLVGFGRGGGREEIAPSPMLQPTANEVFPPYPI